ncbi:MAG: hypothetical protein QOK21_4321 [Solirubrobacteraceae bacterium]|nr:hypothetical protein [Solirubrobacteraceae bacterium]
MNDLTDPVGLVALGAAAVAVVALLLALVLLVRLRRLRAAQTAVLGPGGRDDLVSHAAALHEAFDALHERVEQVAGRLEDRMGATEGRLDGTIAYRALVRYDAYGELSGRQSSSLALLDAAGDGVVLSCITHRDTARLYTKAVHAGHGEHELSPEEDEAIRLALAGETHSSTLD